MMHARRCTKESDLCPWYKEFKELLASFIEHRLHIKCHSKRFPNLVVIKSSVYRLKKHPVVGRVGHAVV
jgi:hypothetical protein